MDTRPVILVIEDDIIDQKAFKRSVDQNHRPFDYEIAGSVAEGKRFLFEQSFDAVVTDYLMGDGTAFDILNVVTDKPVIIVTGAGDEEVAVKAMKAGAYDYLIKDYDRNYLRKLPVTVDNAIRHKRMELGEREQRTLAEALRDTALALNSTLDLEEVLSRILENVKRVVSYDTAYILLIDSDLARVVHYVSEVDPGGNPARTAARFPVSTTKDFNTMFTSRESIVIADVSSYSSWVDIPGIPRPCSYISTPLCAGQEEVIGFLCLSSTTMGFFTPAHVERLRAFADQAATAIENARLYQQAQEWAVVQERQRLARDLHDSVTQTLFTASMLSETILKMWEVNPEEARKGLAEVHKLTQGALAEMRTLLLELRPRALTETDLADLLRQLTTAAAGRTLIDIQLSHLSTEGQRILPPEVQVALYRIAQEALNNVVKHAHGHRAWVNLIRDKTRVELRIRDDGRGFDIDLIPGNRFGVGIMRERAQSIGASFDVLSQVGQGTEIIVRWTPPQQKMGSDYGSR